MTEESAVKVCVRVRPLIAREESTESENTEPVQLFWKADKKSIHQIDDGNSTKSFSFDRVFSAEETTNQLYLDIAKPLVVSSVQGYNGTIFAYGQTSSGKTFTMMGSDHVPGVIPLAVEDVFQTIKNCPKKEFLLRVSYMEIYNETVTDLLVDSWKRKPLEVRENINKNIYVADLTEELVTSPAQALAWIRKGEKNRHYGKTKMNQRSSRSHTIFRMILESRERSDPASSENADGAIIVSHLNLVDLAGSERASQTGAEGTRFKEGCNINRSLFTLAQVIKKLTDEGQKGFTNYRDSKLTRILQNSLGGNAKTVIICTITPVTLDETLGTLQFASTAKKMKNDPHVTEVSDDGALLKRYRNEIVDLKRRLHEVSSVTQTTATEKEVLSQLLQEKDQLQREQEDRIKNLTKLLVTSSNPFPVQKMPKRRVTWGGKMLRLARQSSCGGGGSSDQSFAESFSRKRKASHSYLMELGEDDEDFDAHWEIPDEPSDEMEMSQSSVTVRSFGDSPKDFLTPDGLRELSRKVSNLELQLEMESQQKEQAVTKAGTLGDRVAELELQLQLQTEAQQKHEALEKIQTTEQRAAELELQLQTEAQQKHEALEKIQTTEQRAAELELQLQTEAQQKHTATEKVEMLELRLADLERQLEESSHIQSETDGQMRRDFAETIQLCETLASEKDMVTSERDYLKQELGMFIEQTESLEKEKAALSQELKEKRDMDEFKSLEEAFRKEHEDELKNEISSLKKAIESSELQCLKLQNKLDTLSEELKKKSDFVEELQSMSGKDLVQEVAKLRRSLDDAEGLSRDTRKEWAVLRSQNIAMEETNGTLTANHEKMETEVKSLHFQLETEKSRYRKMQSDLQKELNVAFDENTKLTTLLDGKVPKNLIDSLELERTVANLNKELTASREAEGAFRAQLEELPDKVDNLMKQVCDLTEELCAVQTHRDGLLSAQGQCQEEAQQLRDSLQTSQDEILKIQADLSAAALREKELSQQCADVTQQLDSLSSDLERFDDEKSQLMATIKETGLKLEESEQHRESLEEKLNKMQQLMKDLEEKFADSEVSRTTEEEISKELQEQLNQMTEKLLCVQAEKEQNAGAQSSAEEMEKLLSTVASVTAERDQLKMDIQENVEMMIENQDELRTALEKNREQKERIKRLETAQASKQDGLPSEMNVQQDELQTHIQRLTEELERVRADRDSLLSERTTNTHSEEMEKLLGRVTSLSEERDQLQEILDGLRQEKQQLRAELEDTMETLQTGMIENQEKLRVSQEKIGVLQDEIDVLKSQKAELEGKPSNESDAESTLQAQELQNQIQRLTEELESVRADRDSLLSERTTNTHSEEMEKLLGRVTSLSEERDQLQEILDGLRQEKQQLRAELEDRMEMIQCEQLSSEPQSLKEEQEAQRLLQIQQLEEHLMKTKEELSQLKSDLQENAALMIENQEKLRVSQEKIGVLQDEIDVLKSQKAELEGKPSNGSDAESTLQAQELQNQIQRLTEELESVRADRDSLLSERTTNTHSEEMEKLLGRVTSLSEERDQLQEILDGLRQEKQQLRAELEDTMETLQTGMIENQEKLRASQDKIGVLQDEIDVLKSQKAELEGKPSNGSDAESTLQAQELQNQIQRLTEELESVRADRDSLLSERTTNTHSEEMEKLLGRVTSLSEERDQLQEILDGLRQEKQQLRAELEDRMETLQTEMAQRSMSLQTVTEQKTQLEDALQHNMNMASTTQELLNSVQEELCKQKQMNSDLKKLSQEKEWSLDQQINTLTEKLESIEAERDSLSAERTASTQTLSEERDQLQEILDGLRQEMQQLRAELEDRMEMMKTLTEELESVRADRDSLLSERTTNTHTHSEEMEKLLGRVTSLSEERDQLQEILDGLRQEKQQLRAELEDTMETLQTGMLENQEKLRVSQEKIGVLQDEINVLKSQKAELEGKPSNGSDAESTLQAQELHNQIQRLTEELERVRADRDSLLSERTTNTHSEEMEKLLGRVTSLSEERDQLQEILDGLRQEKQQLRAELEEKMEMFSAIQKKLNIQQQAERGQQEAELQQMQQLEQQLQMYKEKQTRLEAQADTSQQLLSEANTTIAALKEQLSSLNQSTCAVKETASSRLQESTEQLQESFTKFQHFIDTCSKYNSSVLDKALSVRCSLKHQYLTSLPKPTMKAYSAVCRLEGQSVQSLGNIMDHLQGQAQLYKNLFEELVKKDLAVFEERRLQDVLLCRVQAPSHSVKDEDFHRLWEHRLTELLDKRQLYLQKMVSISEKLWANMASFSSEMSTEVKERERFMQQLQAAVTDQPMCFSRLDSILSCELDHRSAVVHSRKMTLKGIIDEQNGLCDELKQLEAQADSQLKEERSKSSTLLQGLEGAPLKTELSLLKDNQQLVLQLQQTEEKVKDLCVQNEHLEAAQLKANNRVSNHKQATQLLQTELQDSRAQVEERENTIQTLRSKLRESEKNASPSAVEQEKLRSKLFKMEVELSSASEKHQQEIQRMTTLVNEKEDSLRKLKETLRKSQQQGDESFLQGEDLHARLTNPRGLVIQSSIVLEKTKLEEEVKELQLKITELESMVSSQQAEISKWKRRAIKLKVKTNAEVDKPSPPCTPTKRGLPMTSDSSNFFSSPKKFLITPKKVLASPRKVLASPRKVLASPRKVLESPRKLLDSPKVSLLHSPKSRFFDVGGSSELLSRTCPKQFFDNSNLGTIPEVSNVPDTPEEEKDAAVGADRTEDWWPKSPKQEDMCKTQ